MSKVIYDRREIAKAFEQIKPYIIPDKFLLAENDFWNTLIMSREDL